MASCVASTIAMEAAREGIELSSLEVEVDSESDDRGILGLDPSTPGGPLSMRIAFRMAADGANLAQLEEIAVWAADHCPVSDAVRRGVPLHIEVTTA
jgi:uncharacterized OsmC-like protein